MGSLLDGNYVDTIKPAGGGDYSNLAAWEDYVDDDPQGLGHAGYWAECYSGGNLGGVDIADWPSSSDTRHPKIYVAKNEGHSGSLSAGAYIEASTPVVARGINHIIIDGLRIKCTHSSASAVNFIGSTLVKNQVVVNTVVHGVFYAGIASGVGSSAGSLDETNCVIRNNLCEISGSGSSTKIGIVVAAIGSGNTVNGWVQNNTVLNSPSAEGSYFYNISWAYNDSCTLNYVLENNYSASNLSVSQEYDYVISASGPNFNLSASNNAQEKATGGLTGIDFSLLSNIDRESQFTDTSSSDYSLKTSSALVNAGKTPESATLSFTSDITQDIKGSSRPQDSLYDIGCFELVVVTVSLDTLSAEAIAAAARTGWQTEMTTLLRYVINDSEQSVQRFSDDRLTRLILTAAHTTIGVVDFASDYSVDVPNSGISPDPTEIKDKSFVNLVILKAAHLLANGDFRKASSKGIVLRDGPSAVDPRGMIEAKRHLAESSLERYKKAELEYRLGNSNAGEAIIGPHRNAIYGGGTGQKRVREY